MPNPNRVLVHPETVEASGGAVEYLNDFARWADLYGNPHIVHFNGRSFRDTPCSKCRGNPRPVNTDSAWCDGCRVVYETHVAHTGEGAPRVEVLGFPSEHLNGACFACSGVPAPKMWSDKARRAYLRLVDKRAADLHAGKMAV